MSAQPAVTAAALRENPGFARVVCALRAGEPAVFSTDTVYGLGVSVRHAASPQAIYEKKGRDSTKPIAWLVEGPAALDEFGTELSDSARDLAAACWPGPVTIIVKASPLVPAPYRSDAGTIGLRMPASPLVLALIEELESPLATSSANLSGCRAVKSAAELDARLIDALPVLVDDGQILGGEASAVVDCSAPRPRLLRTGFLPSEGLELLARAGVA